MDAQQQADLQILARMRDAIRADPEAQDALAGETEWSGFVEQALAWAVGKGVAVTRDVLDRLERIPSSQLPVEPATDMPPPRRWLPASVDCDTGIIEWLHFGDGPLNDPFYYDSIRRARWRPFNRLIPWRSRLADLAAAPRQHMCAPSGFIFHMSRCGSTLVAQMLAAIPEHVVLSEPQPLDAVIQRAAAAGLLDDTETRETVQAMVRMLCRDRLGTARHAFLKLDAWHAAAIPLFRRMFPDVPWIFVHRDPTEVIVSHRRMPGIQAVPGMVTPALLGGVGGDGELPGAAYVARVLAAICGSAIDSASLGAGQFIAYPELPEAVTRRVLPHFGVALSNGDLGAVSAAGRADAKHPQQAFVADGASKQCAADEDVHAAAATLREVQSALDALSCVSASRPTAGSSPSSGGSASASANGAVGAQPRGMRSSGDDA